MCWSVAVKQEWNKKDKRRNAAYYFFEGRRRTVKKKGGEEEEIQNHGLKGPRCTGTSPSNFKKSLNDYRGECIDKGLKKLGGDMKR
jgi:hypothetical protein